jgi:dienelactone hydrolase
VPNLAQTDRVPDTRVRAALANWAPRFTANGVDPSDLRRLAAAVDSWQDWCPAWSTSGAGHEALGRAALRAGRSRSAGEHLATAAVYFHFAKFLLVDHPLALRAAHRQAVGCLSSALPCLDPPGERVEIGFGQTVLPGVLRRPAGPGRHPLVVLIAGLDSAKEEFRAAEQPFLARGMATFSVDGPGQGEAEYDLAARPDWEVPGAAILDRVAALPGIDPARIGLWGVSLGGYYAPRLASCDDRVRACVALSGPYCFGAGWDGLPGLTRDAFTVRSRSAGEAEARQRAGEFTMAGHAARLRVPLLVIAGKRDRIISWRDAARLAAEAAGPSELLLLEDGNHGCANVTYRHRPYAADWMARQLGA